MIVIIYVLSLMCKSCTRKTLSGQLKHSHCMHGHSTITAIADYDDAWCDKRVLAMNRSRHNGNNNNKIAAMQYLDNIDYILWSLLWSWGERFSQQLLKMIFGEIIIVNIIVTGWPVIELWRCRNQIHTHTNTPTWTMKAFVGWRSSTDDKCRQRAGDGWSNNVIHWGSLLILRSFTITIEVIGSRAEDEAEGEGEDQCNIKHCMHRRAAKETYISWRRMNLTAIVFILVYAKRNERFVFSFLPSFRIYILSKGIDLSISEWVSDCFSARGGGSLSGLINWF